MNKQCKICGLIKKSSDFYEHRLECIDCCNIKRRKKDREAKELRRINLLNSNLLAEKERIALETIHKDLISLKTTSDVKTETLKNKVDTLESSINSENKLVESLGSEVKTLMSVHITGLGTLLEEHNKKLTVESSNISEMAKQLEEKDFKIKSLEDKLSSYETKINEMYGFLLETKKELKSIKTIKIEERLKSLEERPQVKAMANKEFNKKVLSLLMRYRYIPQADVSIVDDL